MKTNELNRLYKIIAEQQAYITELNDALYAARQALNEITPQTKERRFKR